MKLIVLTALVVALALTYAAGHRVAMTTQPNEIGTCGSGYACP